MQPKKNRGHDQSHKSIHIQFRLHETQPYEDKAIDEYIWFEKQGFTSRQMGRELLLAHQELRKAGYDPEKTRKPQTVTIDMKEQFDAIKKMTSLMMTIVQSIADGSFTPSNEARQQIHSVAESIGVDMSAAHLAGAVIDININDDDEWE